MATRKPSINTRCVANRYASGPEAIAEVFSPATDAHPARGCLISVREVENAGRRGARGLIIEAYRADADVFVRINGRDYRLPK